MLPLFLPAGVTIDKLLRAQIALVLFASSVNILISSASAKWALLAPVFVPMFMLLGYSPELTQATYRIGDSVTNVISPMMSYFALIVAFVQRYDKQAGLGTVVATMLPYSVWILISGLALTIGDTAGHDRNRREAGSGRTLRRGGGHRRPRGAAAVGHRGTGVPGSRPGPRHAADAARPGAAVASAPRGAADQRLGRDRRGRQAEQGRGRQAEEFTGLGGQRAAGGRQPAPSAARPAICLPAGSKMSDLEVEREALVSNGAGGQGLLPAGNPAEFGIYLPGQTGNPGP